MLLLKQPNEKVFIPVLLEEWLPNASKHIASPCKVLHAKGYGDIFLKTRFVVMPEGQTDTPTGRTDRLDQERIKT